MFCYTVTFSHPELGTEDVTAFLEREFSLWDLSVERQDAKPPQFRITFSHPWLDPQTMFRFLERQYGPEDLSVARDGQAALTFTGAREPSETARPRGPGRKTETLMKSIRGLFNGNDVIDWDRIRTVSGTRPQSAVMSVLRKLVENGEIRRLSQGRYINTDAPDPDPEATSPQNVGALQKAILQHLEASPAATAESLLDVVKGRAKPTIQMALRSLTESGKVRRADHGVYVLDGKPDPSAETVVKLRKRRRQKPTPEKRDAEAELVAFLAEPRTVDEVMAHLQMSRASAARRLNALDAAGKAIHRRVGARYLYGSDPERLAQAADLQAKGLMPVERRVLEILPAEGDLSLPEVARAAVVKPTSALTAIAEDLSQRGLLELRQEGGVPRLSLTEAGARAVQGSQSSGAPANNAEVPPRRGQARAAG